MIQEIEAAIKENYPDAILETGEATGMPMIAIKQESIASVCKLLKEKLGYDFPDCLTAADKIENFELIYNLYNSNQNQSLMLKAPVSKENPTVDSVASIWPGMDWQEREAFDLMGISFKGHPDLRRILLPDDWTVYPLRKDYTETD